MSGDAPAGAPAGLGRAELGERLGGFVYGTIVVLSVIVAGLKAFPHGLWHVALLVAVTTVVFWLAHVYAHGIAFSLGHNEHLSLAELDHIGRREASIVGAGVPPELALVLGATGLLSDHVATWLAFGLGLLVLGSGRRGVRPGRAPGNSADGPGDPRQPRTRPGADRPEGARGALTAGVGSRVIRTG